PASRRLSSELSSLHADALITTGPPHSMHLIGMKLASKRSLPWIADFRDPWTGIHYFSKLPITRIARAIHKRLERRVVREASAAVTVSKTWAREFSKLSDRSIKVIPNGYDQSDFPPVASEANPLCIRYFGSMVPTRNPQVLWRALAELKRKQHILAPRVRVELYGSIDRSVLGSAAKLGLGTQVLVKDYIPNDEALDLMGKSDLLLVTINQGFGAEGMIPGKLYECLASKRPVLLLGPVDGDAAILVREFEAGWVADHEDLDRVKQSLVEWLAGRPSKIPQDQQIDGEVGAFRFTKGIARHEKRFRRFSRRELARNYCSLLDELQENTLS
ncbi:MAG: glycosyltransferase, partial [Pseudomonadota bacterium]